MKAPKRLLLVYPRSLSGSYARMQRMPSLVKRGGYLNAGLATIAALTPPDFHVEIVDEDKQTIDYGRDDDVVGIESTNVESLREADKVPNVETDLLEALKRFHQHGITVCTTSIVGFDHDDLSVFQEQFDFFTQAGVVTPFTFPIQAHDGSRLKDRAVKEGRYIGVPFIADGTASTMFDVFTMRPKQMSIEELGQGVCWLRWELYKPEHVARRARTFFEHFENSPKRKKLRIPKAHKSWEALKTFAGVLKYCLTKSPKEERRAFLQMLGYAKRSSHPQGYGMAMGKFMLMKDMHAYLRALHPDIDKIRYPVRDAVA